MSRLSERLRTRVVDRVLSRGRTRVRGWLAARVQVSLATRRDVCAETEALLRTTRADAARVAARVERDRARLDPSPFSGSLTVHAAHARHPGVRDAFARRGLPRCEDCAVGADETLAEAAFGEAFDLAELLAELDALR